MTQAPPATATEIRIENARSHNLKGVTCAIPLRKLTVVTGVSGSGKSTLVFDTLYAEGQRRYVASLSTYARQFLERLPRPDVDRVSHMPPAIAIEQRNRVTNARSTVGTATEILDYLRLLFAKIGETRCPDCDRGVEPGTVQAVRDRILQRFAGRRIQVGAPLPRLPRESAPALRDRLARDGYTRVIDEDGRTVDWTERPARALPPLARGALLLVDRLRPRPGEEARVAEAVAGAFARGHGRAIVVAEGGERATYRAGFACDGCGRSFPEPVPALFSFNSPLGACPECQGFGRVPGLDLARVVPDPRRSIQQLAIAPFATRGGRACQRDLLRACRRLRIPVDRAWEKLTERQRELVVEGDDGWYGVRGYFEWLEGRRYKVGARVQIARYRCFNRCPECGGSRVRPEARNVRIRGRSIAGVSRLTLEELEAWLRGLDLTPPERARAGRLLDALCARVRTANEVGLGYLGLDRQVRTLSGGEAQRIQLATALGGTLTAALYVLDEPSIGLHARDVSRLLSVLFRIRDHGNTVVVVEHAPEIVEAADHLIDLGPGAGRLGGELVVAGDVETVRRHPVSATGAALRRGAGGGPALAAPGGAARVRETPPEYRVRDRDRAALEDGARRRPRGPGRGRHRVERDGNAAGAAARAQRGPGPSGRNGRLRGAHGLRASGVLRIVGAREHNLRELDVEIPLGRLVVVTGVSGAGKSTLVRSVLVGNLRGDPDRGACARIEGAERIGEVVVVDPTPPGRSSRSNPATVSKAFDPIRRCFAGTREAKAAGAGPGWFSFNVPGGRCEACEGAGEVVVDMQFLDDVRVPCEECGGTRYRREAREIRWKGRSIVDVLGLTIEEALSFFAGEPRVVSRLAPLARVGLGYLTLGQPLSTLSGGEAQRLRVGLALAEGSTHALFVLDEPTTGLHPADIDVLLGCLGELIAAGGSVVVIEHNLDVIRNADHVIDLGPEGGPGGGRLVAAGSPEEVSRSAASRTGAALRGDL